MNEDIIEKIDKYLSGEMSSEERSLFKVELAGSEELSSTVNIYRVIEKEMIENEKRDDNEIALRRTLEELNNRYFDTENREGLFFAEDQHADSIQSKEKSIIKKITEDEPGDLVKVRKISRGIRLAFAASIIAIIGLGVTLYLKKTNNSTVSTAGKITDTSKKASNNRDTSLPAKSTPANNTVQKDEGKNKNGKVEISPGTLYADNFEPDASPGDKEGPLEDALTYYQKKKYINAIEAIDNADLTIVTRGEESDQGLTAFYAHYYKALSYMATENIRKAIPELDTAIVKSTDHLFKIKAQWYLSLACVKTGDLKRAEGLLQRIIHTREASVYKIKSQKLIDALKQLK